MARAKKKAQTREQKKEKKKKENQRNYNKHRRGTFEGRLLNCLYNRRTSAKSSNIQFEISVDDFPPQTNCRLLKRTVFCFTNTKQNKDSSLSIDRIDPTKGYTPDNTWLICDRANRIKNNATFAEFQEIYFSWKEELERRGLI